MRLAHTHTAHNTLLCAAAASNEKKRRFFLVIYTRLAFLFLRFRRRIFLGGPHNDVMKSLPHSFICFDISRALSCSALALAFAVAYLILIQLT